MTGGVDVGRYGGPPLIEAEQWISDALDELGVDSDQVADALRRHEAVAGSDEDTDPVCLYLQAHVDAAALTVDIGECDLQTLTFAVRNPDGDTWTQAVTVLPTPVQVFCCRVDAGDFPDLARTCAS